MGKLTFLEQFKAGEYKKFGEYKYFLPSKINKNWQWQDNQINNLLEKASIKLGKLNSFSNLIPDLDLFLQLHLTNEAVHSSKIEGTKTNINEALLPIEAIEPEKRDDWQEVQNYIKAMNYAINRLKKLPLSSRLLKETHKILLSGVRGKHRNPGEFRKSQNWIGGNSPKTAIYVPPLHLYINDLMTDLENFIHNTEIQVPDLIKIGMIHYQFESIHPFLDGNGRIGRLLITLYLIDKKILEKPLLALSIFFEKYRSQYYESLNNVRLKNDMINWLKFFLKGIEYSAQYTTDTLQKMLKLKKELEIKIRTYSGRKLANSLKLLELLFKKPLIKIYDVQNYLKISYNASNEIVKYFVKLNILHKKQLNKKQRIFVFEDYLKLF